MMQGFKSQGQAQRFVSTHSATVQRHLVARKALRHYRSAAMAQWSAASAEIA